MSKRANKPPNRIVREQLARERRRRRTLWTTLIAIAALAIAVVIGLSVWRSQQAGNYATPAGATQDGGQDAGLLVAGDGPVTVEVYLDFICPVCKQFETAVGPTLDQLITENKIRLVWHPLGFLDRASTTQYSTRSASAAACASDAGALKAYGEALFAQQPPEGSAGLSDDQLIDIGTSAGLTSPSFATCVRDHSFRSWVSHVNQVAARNGVNGTPTVLVNGRQVAQPSPENVRAAVEAAR